MSCARCRAYPQGTLTGRQFAQLLRDLKSNGEFALVDDRKIDWARFQQIWRCTACNEEYVLDYPFERGQGSFRLREEHPTAHLFDPKG